MKRLTQLFFIVWMTAVFGQSKIVVKNAESGAPIGDASILCKNKLVGKTNAQGQLEFRSKCRKVEVKAPGFYDYDVVVDKVMEAPLLKADAKTHSIEAVLINDKSDPLALAILDKVNDRFKNNSPESLDSYQFKSYEKISYDLDEDSIAAYTRDMYEKIDSLKTLPEKKQTKKEKKDSTESLNMMHLMTGSKLFLWERASEFLYSKKLGEKINVLDNRVSGLQQPIYEMLSLRSNRNRIPREIRKENRSLYRYFLTDSIDIDGRKNYVIRFRDAGIKTAVQRRKYNGFIYVDAQTYGLKKIESNSHKKSEGSITSVWIPIADKWFLSKENLKIKMGMTYVDDKMKKDETTGEKIENKDRRGFGNYVYMIADYFDFKTPVELTKKDFSGYSMSVIRTDGSTIQQYRTDSLSQREKMTYTKIDSVGQKYKLDQKLNVLRGLLYGDIRLGKFNLDATDLVEYNNYEGVRLGLTFKGNEKLSRYLSPDAYVAYAFKDRAWKYGAGIDVKTTLKKVSFFRAEFYHDVDAAGRYNQDLWNIIMRIMNSGVDLNNANFYQYQGGKISFQHDLTNALTFKISAKRDREEALFNYNFMDRGNRFENFATQLTLHYSPRSKNIMTPSGKFTYEQNYPDFFLNYEQGLRSLGGELQYSRFDFLAQHRFRTKIGVTGFRVYAGLTVGDVPIWHQFVSNGLGDGKDALNFNLTSYLGFATMKGGAYYNDKFVGYYFTHRIPWYFRTIGKTVSSFDLVYKGEIGNMRNPQHHQFQFSTLDKLYQEVGLEYNNFLGTSFNLGFFYRVGQYATNRFGENFAIQLKLKFLGF